MGIQITKQAKVLVTSSVTEINTDQLNLTADNTSEILVLSGSISFSQDLSEEFIDPSNYLDTTENINIKTYKRQSMGSGSLSCLLSSNPSTKYPLEFRLWNGLVSAATFPGDRWTSTNEYSELKLLREVPSVNVFGVIIILNEIVYKFNRCRITGANISLGIEELASVSWTFDFETYEVLGKAQEYNLPALQFGIFIAGNSSLELYYKKAIFGNSGQRTSSGRFVKLGVSRAGEAAPRGYLASTGVNIALANALEYLDNKDLDSGVNIPIFAGAKSFTCSGTFSAYMREHGSYVNSLVQEVIDSASDFYKNPVYKLFIEVYNGPSKVVDIILDGVSLTVSNEIDATVMSNFSFQLIKNTNNQNCSIKFYA